MSNNITVLNDTNNIPALPADLAAEFGDNGDDLISASGGFPVLSIRGSKWRVKISGEEHPLLNAETDDPVPSVELVIVAAQPGLSKIYYEQDYKEGDAEAPSCFSVSGEKPDPMAASKQSATCATCPKQVWGSKITPAGKKAKACSDAKRLAVTFASSIPNEQMGGAMLLRVPADSLKDLTQFGRELKNKGFSYQRVVIRAGFDMNASYPKLTFKAVRLLNNDELRQVVELKHSDGVSSILNEAADIMPPKPAAPAAPVAPKAVDTEFEVNPEPAPMVTLGVDKKAAAPVAPVATKPKAVPAPKTPAKPKAAPAPAPVEDESEGDLDLALSALEGLTEL